MKYKKIYLFKNIFIQRASEIPFIKKIAVEIISKTQKARSHDLYLSLLV